MRSDCTQLGHIVCTLCTHCVRSPQRLATCAFAGALQTQQGRAQKVSPGANVFSWQFCTRTSRSRQLNRYGWRAMGLQRWVGWGEGTNKVRHEKQPQRAGQEPCLCVPKIVHLHPKSAVGFRCAGQMENVIMRFCLKCYFLPLPRGLLP